LFTIKTTTTFIAGHQLDFPAGPEPYHIHDWQVETAITGSQLDENGLLFDFTHLKNIVIDLTTPFNDRALEDFDCFKNINTSAENVAKYLFTSIKNQLPANISLLYVEVTEALGCKAQYSEV
jgi:6-pyruvoyltetrahydropterin/6-carboxytetrahydropterin synthase